MSVRILADPDAAAEAAAAEFLRVSTEAVSTRRRFTVALTGGSTPRRMYMRLASIDAPFRSRIAWSAIHLFWGDERHVPPDHADSNYRMAWETLLAHVSIPDEHIHRIKSEHALAETAAVEYERELLNGAVDLNGSRFPRFDLILLGLGPDGHTASLFPGSDALTEQARLVVAPWVQSVGGYRITLTPPVLNKATAVMFLVCGGDKAAALRNVLEGESDPAQWPAQIVQPPDGSVLWIVDRAAAAKLTRGGLEEPREAVRN